MLSKLLFIIVSLATDIVSIDSRLQVWLLVFLGMMYMSTPLVLGFILYYTNRVISPR